MKQLFMKVLTGQIRIILLPIVMWLSHRGYISNDETTQTLIDLSTGAAMLIWSAYDWIQSHQDELLARAMRSGTTAKELATAKNSGAMVPITTGATESPVIIMKDAQ